MEIGTLLPRGVGEETRFWLADPGQGLGSMLLSGQTGSGKSTTATRITSRLAARSDVALVGIDLKGGAELGPWEPRFTKIVTTKQEAFQELQTTHHTILHRAELMETVAKIEGTSIRMWQPRMGPWLAVVVDEMAELLPEPGERGGMKALNELAACASLGRALGVILVCCTQYALRQDFPGRLLTNLPTRICHRMGTETEYRVALNVTKAIMDSANFRAISLDEKGLSYVTGVAGVPDMSMLKATVIEDDDVTKIAEDTSDLRWPEAKVYAVPPAQWVADTYPRERKGSMHERQQRH